MEYSCNVNNCEYNDDGKCVYCGDYWTLNDINCFSFIDINEVVEDSENREDV